MERRRKSPSFPLGAGQETMKRKALLLGLGLDNKDGHIRITKGPNFQLTGGTQSTHERMQDIAIRFNEELDRKGKNLENLHPEEMFEMLDKARGNA